MPGQTTQKTKPIEHSNKDGSPDMRLKENRDDPRIVEEKKHFPK